MENKETENTKLDQETLDQIAGGNILDDAVGMVKTGIGMVKETFGTAMDAGEALLTKAKDTVSEKLRIPKPPVQRDQDDSYRFGD